MILSGMWVELGVSRTMMQSYGPGDRYTSHLESTLAGLGVGVGVGDTDKASTPPKAHLIAVSAVLV